VIFLVCYDIRSPKRLAKVAKLLERYGLRVQKSFFMVEGEWEMIEEMKREVFRVMKLRLDSFFVYPLCRTCYESIQKDGTGDMLKVEDYRIL